MNPQAPRSPLIDPALLPLTSDYQKNLKKWMKPSKLTRVAPKAMKTALYHLKMKKMQNKKKKKPLKKKIKPLKTKKKHCSKKNWSKRQWKQGLSNPHPRPTRWSVLLQRQNGEVSQEFCRRTWIRDCYKEIWNQEEAHFQMWQVSTSFFFLSRFFSFSDLYKIVYPFLTWAFLSPHYFFMHHDRWVFFSSFKASFCLFLVQFYP